MKKALVRCRCGHQVLAREVLRTDLYERSMGREYVYVKFRCKRCKRMGEAFVAENRWDWSILEPAPGEMNAEERDRFLDAEEISDADVEEFHRQLEGLSHLNELARMPAAATGQEDDSPDAVPAAEAANSEAGSPDTVSNGPSQSSPPPGSPQQGNPQQGSPQQGNPQNVASNAVPHTNPASPKRPPSGDEKRPRS